MKSTPADAALCAVAALPQDAARDLRAILGAPALDVARTAPGRALLAVDAVVALHRLEGHKDAREACMGLLELARSHVRAVREPERYARWTELMAVKGAAAHGRCKALGMTDSDIDGTWPDG